MKRCLCLVVAVLCLSAMMCAKDKDKDKQTEMTGTICNSKCVVPQSNTPTCDLSCTDKSGDVVLVDDSGKVTKIENAKMAMPHMGKKVKAMVVPSEKEREGSLRIMQINEMKY